MDVLIHSIKTSRCIGFTPNRHTVHKTRRASREPCERGGQASGRDGKPPPGRRPALCGLLDENLMAVDFAIIRRIDRLFLFLGYFVGCRSPPCSPFSPIPGLYENGGIIMVEIKNPEAYFGTMVRNSYKNEFRANDNFFNHISSVGDESDIQQESTQGKNRTEPDANFIEQHLCESSIQNWLLFMENVRLHYAITQLRQTDIQHLYLRFVLKYSNIEIAAHFGLSANAVAKWKRRLINKLKKFL